LDLGLPLAPFWHRVRLFISKTNSSLQTSEKNPI
jgi:hypothetical protein